MWKLTDLEMVLTTDYCESQINRICYGQQLKINMLLQMNYKNRKNYEAAVLCCYLLKRIGFQLIFVLKQPEHLTEIYKGVDHRLMKLCFFPQGQIFFISYSFRDK